ncbi:MAG TPA: GNAT family N-acetyltransferase [Acetobacteraceae bacterium]|nr:GNAT family N-acetyltransferase [Acetobacteraceae bacterium]
MRSAPLPVGVEAAPLLAALHGRAFPPAEAWGPDAIAMMLGLRGAFALLAQEAGEPAGFGLARTVADEAELLTLAVRPDARRRGHARALLVGIAADAAARGARALFLEVSETNAAARALYEGVGAVEVGRRAGYYADGSAALVLRLQLET